MFNRACRILAPSATEKSTETSTTKGASANLSTDVRLSLWKKLLLKMFLILQTVYQQNKAKFLLGEKVYNNLFASSTALQVKEPTKCRFLKGQMVGKARSRGTGRVDTMRANMDPSMCQHPDHLMRARGNKGDQWWICTGCLSRWDRLEASDPSPNDCQDLGLLKFGKHMGSTFLEVYEQDREYCLWILETVEKGDPSAEIHQFAQYLQNKLLEETYECDNYHMELDPEE